MDPSDKYHELKLEIARAAAKENNPSLERFCRAFTEEFGLPPPADMIAYFNRQMAQSGHPVSDDEPSCGSEIEWSMDSPDPRQEASEGARFPGAPTPSRSGAAKALLADLEIHPESTQDWLLEKLLATLHHEGVILTDAQGIIAYCSPAAETLLGVKFTEVSGLKSIGDFLRPAGPALRDAPQGPRKGHGAAMMAQLAGELNGLGSGQTVEQKLITAGGDHLTVDLAVTPLQAENGTLKGYIVAFSDQTRLMKILAQLGSCLEDHELQNAERLAVLEQLARVIRTPLTSILGFCNLLQETRLADGAAAHVDKIEQSVDRLITSMGDYIDLYRIRDGELHLMLVEFDLRELAAKVIARVAPRLGAKPVKLSWQVSEQAPSKLWGDARRLRQVLTTLLGNAVQHTAAGEVILDIEAADLEAEKVQFQISVRDTGAGISPEKEAELFAFHPATAGKRVSQPGAQDLNLFVCRHIARRMQGDLTVTSIVGHGTTFQLTIWLARADLPPMAQEGQPPAGKSVFFSVAESDPADQLQSMLEAVRMEVQRFESPKEMFSELFTAIEKERAPQLCICGIDASTPGGMKSIKNFKLARVLNPELRLIGIASPTVWEKNKDLESLFDVGLNFPLEEQELHEALHKLILPSPALTAAEGKPNVGHRILVAEDEPFHFDLLQEIFNRAGHVVTWAKSGQDLVNQYLFQPEQFDIIFTDLEMPEMDGRQAVRQIRSAGHNEIPIVAVSSQFDEAQRDQCLKAGFNDFIPKPFRQAVLLTVLRRHLG